MNLSGEASRCVPVRVVARLRPYLGKDEALSRCVWVDDPEEQWSGGEDEEQTKAKETVRLKQRCRDDAAKRVVRLRESACNAMGAQCVNEYKYQFSGCYGEDADQQEIFDNEIKHVISKAFEGFNTTCMAYGVTGSGKTYTMQGTENNKGLIARSVQRALHLKAQLEKKHPSVNCKLALSYLEIYKDKCYDLIQCNGRDLPVRETGERRIVIPGLHQEPITTLRDFTSVYEKGCKNRTTGATNLNVSSSRSHAILVLQICYRQVQAPFKLINSKLNFIDLAGSEDNRITGNRGVRLSESNSINRSLFVLGNVVSALNAGHKRVPFRDSKITRLIQDSLGGDSYAVLVCNIAPSENFYLHTLNTLAFGTKAQNITNRVVPNTVSAHDSIKDLVDPPDHQVNPTVKRKSIDRNQPGVAGKRRRVPLNSNLPDDFVKPVRTSSGSAKTADMNPTRVASVKNPKSSVSVDVKCRAGDPGCEKRPDARLHTNDNQNKADSIVAIGKQKLAKELITEAKQLKRQNMFVEALTLYNGALELLPENARLLEKVAQVEKLANMQSCYKENVASLSKQVNALLTPVVQRQAFPSVKRSVPRAVVNTLTVIDDLNNATEKDLCRYAKIGRATALQIIRARSLKPFASLNDLALIGKTEHWIAQFCTHNSIVSEEIK